MLNKKTIKAIADDPDMTIMYALLDAYTHNLSGRYYAVADEILEAYQACAAARWPELSDKSRRVPTDTIRNDVALYHALLAGRYNGNYPKRIPPAC